MRFLRAFNHLSPRLASVLESILYALLSAFALHATWLTWPDAYIDFSRELYLPWRVSCGDILYHDLAYYFGPLSVYTNAALFALFGRPSIHALFALNFAFWIATLLALRSLLRRIARPAVATVCISVFILLFSFNRYIACGNFNYLAPYSHELPRGHLLSLLALLALDSAFRRFSRLLFALSGLLLGLSLFTKPEIALAVVCASIVLFLSHFHWGRGQPAHDGGSEVNSPSVCLIFPFVCGAFLALTAVLLPLSLALGSFSQALHDGFLKIYLDCFNPAMTSLPFFKGIMGTDDIPLHLAWLLLGSSLAILPFLPLRLLLTRSSSRPLHIATTSLLALMAAAIGFFGFNPLNATLVLFPVALGILSLRSGVRPFLHAGQDSPSFALTLAFAVFAFLLVSKMLLNASITFYGFVLALPAFCCAVLLAFRAPCSPARAVVSAALLLGFSAGALRLQAATFCGWNIHHPVHDAACRTDPDNARAFNTVLSWIRTNTAPDSTLAVLPEGAILNVLSRRPNPTPYVSIPDTDWPRYDEAALLAAYSNSLPDTLVLVRKPQKAVFGTDYAQSLMRLLDPLYSPAFAVSVPTPSGPVPYLLVATRSQPPS